MGSQADELGQSGFRVYSNPALYVAWVQLGVSRAHRLTLWPLVLHQVVTHIKATFGGGMFNVTKITLQHVLISWLNLLKQINT